jgi:hypothetical protein
MVIPFDLINQLIESEVADLEPQILLAHVAPTLQGKGADRSLVIPFAGDTVQWTWRFALVLSPLSI